MRRSPLAIVYLTVFIDLMGFGIILPNLPYYAQNYGANGLWLGAIMASYSTAQFLGAPILGRLSDRFGRRPVLLTSLAGSAISLTWVGLAHSLLLLLARAVAGLCGGSISAAQAYIADVTKPNERAKYMGMLGASIGMGFIFGPAIGSGLSRFGFNTAAFVAAGLAAANFVFGYFALAESRSAERATTPLSRFSFENLTDALRHPSVGRILTAMFLVTLAFVGMEATLAFLGQQQFGLESSSLGWVLTYVGIVAAIVQGGLVGRLNARFGERVLAVSGALVMGLSLATLPLVHSLVLAMVVLGGLALGQGLLSPTLSSLLSRESDPDERGGTLGLGQSLSAGARAVGPVTAGWLFDRGVALPYFTGAALVLLTAWLLSGVVAPQDETAVSGMSDYGRK